MAYVLTLPLAMQPHPAGKAHHHHHCRCRRRRHILSIKLQQHPFRAYISHKCQRSSEQIEYFVCAWMISSVWKNVTCTIQLNYSHLFFTSIDYKLTFYWKSIVDSSLYLRWGWSRNNFNLTYLSANKIEIKVFSQLPNHHFLFSSNTQENA